MLLSLPLNEELRDDLIEAIELLRKKHDKLKAKADDLEKTEIDTSAKSERTHFDVRALFSDL